MKRFLKILALFFAPVLLLHGFMYLVLLRSGELVPPQKIVQDTLDGEIRLFGTAYRDETQWYKYRIASEKGASLLVMGTSRAMQLRGGFFGTDDFYNIGGSMPFVGQARIFLQRLPKDKLPERILLVLDQYFYNEYWANLDDNRDYATYRESEVNHGYALRRMFTDLADGKYNPLEVLRAPTDVRGMSAAGRQAGFYADGSYSYGNLVVDENREANRGFADSMMRITLHTNRFEEGEYVSLANLILTELLLEFCAENDIAVTAFLPPYAPAVWERMQETGKYTYLDKILGELQPRFAQYGFEIFDYSYLPETQDAQYIDGFHGSDRVYAAVCARLAEDSQLLADVLDKDALTQLFTAPGHPLTVDLPDA